MEPKPTLERGHLYRIKSRNLPYGVFDGKSGFIGIREKFLELYLFTEYDYDDGPPFGTVRVLEDLGPSGIEPIEGTWAADGSRTFHVNQDLYDYLAAAEVCYGRGEGYGMRPGDER